MSPSTARPTTQPHPTTATHIPSQQASKQAKPRHTRNPRSTTNSTNPYTCCCAPERSGHAALSHSSSCTPRAFCSFHITEGYSGQNFPVITYRRKKFKKWFLSTPSSCIGAGGTKRVGLTGGFGIKESKIVVSCATPRVRTDSTPPSPSTARPAPTKRHTAGKQAKSYKNKGSTNYTAAVDTCPDGPEQSCLPPSSSCVI